MIGERIKVLRKARKYSITELAKQAGVSKSYLSYIERDVQRNPSLQFLSKLANTLGTSIEYLLGEVPTENNVMDEDWQIIFQKAIDSGLSKEDFDEFVEFIKYKQWEKAQRELK